MARSAGSELGLTMVSSPGIVIVRGACEHCGRCGSITDKEGLRTCQIATNTCEPTDAILGADGPRIAGNEKASSRTCPCHRPLGPTCARTRDVGRSRVR